MEYSPLVTNVLNHDVASLRANLQAGVDPNEAGDITGITPLIAAADSGSSGMVEVLLESNASADLKDQVGITALMVAALRGHSQIVRLLLNASAGVNTKARDGSTALMYGVLSDSLDVVRILLEAGADVNMSNELGLTPLILASRKPVSILLPFEGLFSRCKKNREMISLLKHYGAAG